MMSFIVKDLPLSESRASRYDIAMFSSGYEERCTHAPKYFESTDISEVAVFGFTNLSNTEQRRRNDSYFREQWKRDPDLLNSNDDGIVYEYLQRLANAGAERIRVLVDYSSMSRLWYAAIINWARFVPSVESIEIDFVYSIGRYEPELIPIVIHDILPIPGCEGGSLRFSKTVAIFGLGFYGAMADCVMEHLEPDTVYAFLASPGASEQYLSVVKKSNEFLLSRADSVLEVPLTSVEMTVRYLTELVIPELPHSEVVLVPMGPKPHGLACILVSMQFGDVSCLRVSAKRERTEQVPATGELLATRVLIQR
ncbi:MAG: hypothetical protein IID44_17995 [Planctomycetes bacterium]|nr:hypothetical protein [Planctomycetota bacterium]